MADNNISTSSSLSSTSTQNGRTGLVPKHSPTPHQNGSLEMRPEHQSLSKSKTPVFTSPLRTLGTIGGLKTPTAGSGSESSSRSWGQSLGSALSSRVRTSTSSKDKGLQEEPEALLDLILESQSQRLEDQRASLSLLPEPDPSTLCGACNPDQTHVPTLDFYYMLIHYQSDRMEDQRCSLPHLDDVIGLVSDGQEDFFSLVQRVQSRRMDEQRASVVLRPSEDDRDAESGGSSLHHRHHHHH